MEATEVLSEEVTVARHESGRELKSAGIHQDPMTQRWEEATCRLTTRLTALESELAQPRKRIFIVGDHPNYREKLTQILNDTGDLTVCGMAHAVDQALPAIARAKPDLVLADIDVLGKSGLELIKKLRAVDRSVKLLIISMQTEAFSAARVLRSGGDGYITKQESQYEIVCAIHDVLENHLYVSEQVMERPRYGGAIKSIG
jgi:DNA-binding NtrC family response regulator